MLPVNFADIQAAAEILRGVALVIAGQGTCMLEFLSLVPDLEVVLAPVGGVAYFPVPVWWLTA